MSFLYWYVILVNFQRLLLKFVICNFESFLEWGFERLVTNGLYLFCPQIEILLGKTESFDELMAAAAEKRDAGDGEEQS